MSQGVSCSKVFSGKLILFLLVVVLMLSSQLSLANADTLDYSFKSKWGTYGTGDGQFDWPEGLESDRYGNVYVVDTFNHRIQKFDSKGNFLDKWGTYGTGDGQFKYPYDIAINSLAGRAYVTDTRNNRIQVFDLDGNYLDQFNSGAYNDPDFKNPLMIPYAASMVSPYGIAVNAEGDIYITGWFTRLTEVSDGLGGYTYSGISYPGVQVFDSSLNAINYSGWDVITPGNRFISRGIDIDFNDRVFIANTTGNKIQLHDQVGSLIKDWGVMGSAPGNFNWPSGISVDNYGNVFVADKFNHRIQVFNSDSTYITSIGSFGKNDGYFSSPAGVEVDPNGRVFVADTGYDRIQKFLAGSILINNGDEYTNDPDVTVTLKNLSPSYDYKLGNDTSSYSAWTPFKNDVDWPLESATDGTKTVYALTEDRYNNSEDDPLTDTIILDRVAPTGSIVINNGDTTTTSSVVQLALSAGDNASGVSKMRFSTDGADWSDWQAFAGLLDYTISGNDGAKTVYVEFQDKAGNSSATYSDSILLDTKGPVGTVEINNDDEYTNSTSVNLDLTAVDVVSPTASIDIRISNDGENWSNWSAFVTDKAWNMSKGKNPRTVFVEFRDESSNITQAQDSIILDQNPPTGFIKWASKYVKTTSAILQTDTVEDDYNVEKMRMSFGRGSLDSQPWIDYATSKQFTLANTEGEQTIYGQFKDSAGNNSEVFSADIFYDKSLPKTIYIYSPSVSTYESLLGSSYKVKWLGTDNDGSGIARYIVQQKVDTGSWSTLYSNTKLKSASRSGVFGHIYRYKFRVVDNAGNESPWSGITSTVVPLDQDVMKYSSKWRESTGISGYFLETLSLSNVANAFATYKTTCKGFYIIGSVGPYYGKMDVYINGVKVKTVDLYSPKKNLAEVIFVKKYNTAAVRTIKIVVTGKKNSLSKGTWVDLDGIGPIK